MITEETLSGWSSFKYFKTKVFKPKNSLDLKDFIKNNKNNLKVIARGHGCSFGDQAICSVENGVTIDLSNLDKIVELDENKKILKVQGATKLKEILQYILPRNLTLNCIPGGLEITVGGAISNNVHGKDCWKNGYFDKNVKTISIINSNGDIIKLSRDDKEDHFRNMFSSIGLLGIIIEVELFVKEIPSQFLKTETKKVTNIDEMEKCFDNLTNENDYAVAWLDCFAKNKNLFRGIFQTASFYENKNVNKKIDKTYFESPDQKKIMGFIPIKIVWKIVKIFFKTKIFRFINAIIFHLSKFIIKNKIIPYVEFMMLETKYLPSYKSWFEPYGFLTIQPFFRKEKAFNKIKEVIILCQNNGIVPFWCPIKKYKKNNNHPLNFCDEGYSIVIDFFPKEYDQNKVNKFIKELENLIYSQGGKFYLAKDQIMSKDFFRKTYDRTEEFKEIKSKYDPNDIFISNQYLRLFN